METLNSVPEEDFDWSLDPRSLRDAFKRTNFDSIFYKLIAKDVIKILSPQLLAETHNLVYDEELVFKHLIGPLEKFICNLGENATQDDIDKTLQHFQTLNQPSKICRRILKTGDVTFSCNDCGLDGTCVVCIDCFHKGAHKDHNYRMSNSDGGGCCDCGDVEAWKQNYACSDHMNVNQTNLSLSDFEDIQLRSKQIEYDKKAILEKIARLPKGVASKYFLVCQASLHYARLILSWNDYNSIPPELQVNTKDLRDSELTKLLTTDASSKNYLTVLFNDEVHTYELVIGTLVKIIKCTKMTASIIASTVSREGRSLILNDNLKACKQVRDLIAGVRDVGQGALKVEVIHGSILAHQAFALKLIEWVRKMSSLCDAFRILTAYTLLGSFDSVAGEDMDYSYVDMTMIEKIMLSNTFYWKIARVEWNDLFVTTMLTEYSIKEQFARLITRIYPKLMSYFIRDDHDHSVSILTMTTQLYTVPSLICMLIEEENALSIITETLIDTCKHTKRENPSISFENRNTFDMQGLKRGFYIISDLRHLINIQPTKWTDQLRKNVTEAVKIFLNLLTSMQGMDSVRRQLGQHLEYEPDWESGMTLQSRLISYITRLVAYCSFDDEVLVATLKETQNRLIRLGGFKMVTKDLFGHRANCIQYDVSTAPVSVHLPLTRFTAALIVELMRRRPCDRVPYDESLVILTEPRAENRHKHSMIEIMEPSLRTEVMIAQFRSGMWRRNGYSLVNQILYFHGAIMRREMFDRDILVLQEGAATTEANEFMLHLLNKFQLTTWVSSDQTREPLTGPKAVSFHNDEEILTQTMSLGEEFLQLLLTIINERYRVGVGVIEEDDVIKNEIIQLLCISPSTRSDLTQKLYVNDNELDCIKAVANLRRSTEASTGKYELKEEFYERFNPFFYHYSRRNQSNALDAQLKRKKNLKESLLCCPPPKPVELTRQFGNLNELLRCDITLLIIKRILTRTLGPPEGFQECSTKAPIRFTASDLQLDQCLHLIGLGLYEQEREPLNFNYLVAAYEKGIFSLLAECYDKAKRSKDLIFWLMKKTNELIETLHANYSEDLPDKSWEIISNIKECFNIALSTCDTMKQESKKRNSELAAQRRERIMAMMKANQDKFLSNPTTKQLVADTESTNSSNSCAPSTSGPSSNQSSLKISSKVARKGPRVGPFMRSTSGSSDTKSGSSSMMECQQQQQQHQQATNTDTEDNERMDCESEGAQSVNMENEENEEDGQTLSSCLIEPPETTHLCILCRDEQKIGFDQPTMVLLAYIQRSAVLSKNRAQRRIPNYALTPSNHLKYQQLLLQTRSQPGNSPDMYSFTSDNSWSFDATFMPADLFFGPQISTCGHVMHYDCWQGFFDAILKRETSRPNRNARHISFELEKHEILCPLCECISNATIPLLPNYTNFARRGTKPNNQVATIFSAKPETIEKSSENLSACLHALRGTVDMFKHIRHIREVSTNILVTQEDKYIRLLQPRNINDVLEELDEAEALGLRDFLNSIRSDKISSSKCTRSLLSSISTLAERIHTVGLDLDRSITDVNHARIFMMNSWSISYSIQAYERVSRFKGSPLFDDIESPKNLCLSSLLRSSCSSMMIHQSDMMQSLLVRKLRYLLINDEHLSSSPCCLDIDAFEMFVSLFILLQKLYAHRDDSSQVRGGGNKSSAFSPPSAANTGEITEEMMEGISAAIAEVRDFLSPSFNSSTSSRSSNTDDDHNYAWTTCAYDHEYLRNLLHLILILNMLQVIVSMQNEMSSDVVSEIELTEKPDGEAANSSRSTIHSEPSSSSLSSQDQKSISKECLSLYAFYKEIILASGHPNDRMPTVDEKFVSKLKHRLLPFLRSCAVFFFHLSQNVPPEQLRKKSAFFEGKEFLQPTPRDTTTASRNEVTEEFVDAQQSFSKDLSVDASATNNNKELSEAEQVAANEEFNSICQYLDLPNNFSILLKSQEARHLARAWLRHSRVLILIKSALSEQQQQQQQQKSLSSTELRRSTSQSSGHLKRVESSSIVPQSPLAESSSGLASSYSSAASTSTSTSTSASSTSTSTSSSQAQISKTELMPVKFIRQPHLVNRLIELPYDYSELVDKVSDFTCPSIKNEDSRTPTMCLVCGVMLCSQSYCCQRDLNDLASNYQQILQRHREQRQQAIHADSLGSSSSSSAAAQLGAGATGSAAAAARGSSASHYLGVATGIPANTVAAISYLNSIASATGQGTNAAAAGAAADHHNHNPHHHHHHHLITSGSSSAAAATAAATAAANLWAIQQQLVGSCTYHAYECSGGVGVFLRIRNCQILLLSGRSKGCYMPAPYIDDHGETDFGLVRGNPLHLNRQHYEKLQQMWLNHAIPEQISRTLEYSPYASGYSWFLH